MRSEYRLSVVACLLVCLVVAVPVSGGTYKDRDGVAHPWTIDESHALLWESAPYVPFGIVFEPRYLSSGQTDENWKADEEDIAAFKLAGVSDLILRPGKGLSAIPVEAFQRVVDLLEANGLRYGVELYDPPYAQASGFVVSPATNRVDGVRASGQVSRTFPGAKSVIYALCDARTGEVKDIGRVAASDAGEVTVPVVVRGPDDHIVLFYPEKAATDGLVSLPDLWSTYDRHRDRLISILKQVRFGKGLRFFTDPFTDELGMSGDIAGMVPVSPAYRLEFAAWLRRKYNNARDLTLAWGILKHDLSGFDEAVRLLPLWNTGRGSPSVYDLGANAVYAVDVPRSNMWGDLHDFRSESIRAYMDSMADALKRLIADVPVVYTATGFQPIFQGLDTVGFDGLAAPAKGSASAVNDSAGKTFSLAEGSSRRVWLISRIYPGDGYAKKEDLFSVINGLRDLGVKGFFAAGTGGTAIGSADMLTWLSEYASLSSADRQFAGYRPRAIYYPTAFTQGKVMRFPSDIWWLPALKPGGELSLGSFYQAYTLVDPKSGSRDIYVRSPGSSRKVTLAVSDAITVTAPDGTTTQIKPRKGRVQFDVTSEPVLVRGVTPDLFLPIEMATEELSQFEAAIARAEQKRLDVSEYRRSLKDARQLLDKNLVGLCLDIVRTSTNEINLRMRGLDLVPSLNQSNPRPGG